MIGRPVQRAVGDDADERTLEHAHVVDDAVGDDGDDLVVGEGDAVVGHALAQDGDARAAVRRSDVGDQSALEALAQAVLERVEVARQAVGGQDELGAAFVEGVEGVEELLLGTGLALQELDVVDQQDVRGAVRILEPLDPTGL